MTLSTRNLVRLLSFTMAIVLLALGFTLKSRSEARAWRGMLEITYARSLGELSANLTNIAADLEKERYIGTSAQLSKLSARIWRESGSAKSALSSLPMSTLHLDNAYRFLSQAGDYCMALSKKALAGTLPTQEDREAADALRTYAAELRDYVDAVQRQTHLGQIALTAPLSSGDDTEGTQVSGVAAGFADLEQTVTGYPTLIYDGPFSDHLLTRTPRMTQNARSVSPNEAAEIAAKAASLGAEELIRQDDENSAMASYVFGARQMTVGVTKAGGYVSYLINARPVGDTRLREDAIFTRSEQFLASQGLTSMHATYYETVDGVCIINYAATKNDIVLYTDLVKVGVALDDGGIIFYDARGYLVNHYDRTFDSPSLTVEQASASVSKDLEIDTRRLALIPTDGQNEVLTYEFQAVAKDDPEQRVLVYVNAQNGMEENILLMLKTPEGTLTK